MSTKNFKEFLHSQVYHGYDSYPKVVIFQLKSLATELELNYLELLNDFQSNPMFNKHIREIKSYTNDDCPGIITLYINEKYIYIWILSTLLNNPIIDEFKNDVIIAINEGYELREDLKHGLIEYVD